MFRIKTKISIKYNCFLTTNIVRFNFNDAVILEIIMLHIS